MSDRLPDRMDRVTRVLLAAICLYGAWQWGRAYGQHEADPPPRELHVTIERNLAGEDMVTCLPMREWEALVRSER